MTKHQPSPRLRLGKQMVRSCSCSCSCSCSELRGETEVRGQPPSHEATAWQAEIVVCFGASQWLHVLTKVGLCEDSTEGTLTRGSENELNQTTETCKAENTSQECKRYATGKRCQRRRPKERRPSFGSDAHASLAAQTTFPLRTVRLTIGEIIKRRNPCLFFIGAARVRPNR